MSNTKRTCPNCGATIGCGCQRRTAINGTPACKKCVSRLNISIRKKRNSSSTTHYVTDK